MNKTPKANTGMSGDKFKYLGHFRQESVLKAGHNYGAPAGKAPMPSSATTGVPKRPKGPQRPVGLEQPGFRTKPTKPIVPGTATSMRADSVGGGATTATPKALKPTFNATTNPIAATKQANRTAMQSARASGGDVKAVRQSNKAALGVAKEQRASRNEAGLHKTDAASLRSAVGAVRQQRQQMRQGMRGKQML